MSDACRKGDAVAELQTTTGTPALPALEHGPGHVDGRDDERNEFTNDDLTRT